MWKCVFLMITFCIRVECPARREGRRQGKLRRKYPTEGQENEAGETQKMGG